MLRKDVMTSKIIDFIGYIKIAEFAQICHLSAVCITVLPTLWELLSLLITCPGKRSVKNSSHLKL